MGTARTAPGFTPVSRRAMEVEDYLAILRRNVGWVLGPTLVCLVIAVVVAFLWPNTYVSTASIRIVPPQVPERFVPTNVNVQMVDRIRAMQDTILSRNALTNIIQSQDLYRKKRSRMPMEDIIEQMRDDIHIGMPRAMGGSGGMSAFVISFRYENRYAAQKVTRDLMSRFMDENIRDRSSQSQLTTQFLREEYEKAKAQLDTIQKKLTEFRMANIGRLPDQMNSNLQQVSSLEARISALNANASRANQEKLLLESELRGYRERLNAVLNYVPGGTAGPGQRPVREVDEQLAALDAAIRGLERQLERYLEQYSPNYPDVKRIQARLASVKKEREDYLNKKLAIQPAAAQPDAAPSAAAPARTAAARSPEATELQAQIEKTQTAIRAKEIEAERYIREIAEADRKLKDVHSRIESGPIGAGLQDQLLRDYDLAKARYDEMNSKVAQSETATEVETRKQGETLEVLDLPSLPESPADPNRYMIVFGGTAVGLMIGAGMVFAREMKDQSLKSLKDVRAYTQFNVLGSVPLLENDLVVRRRRRIAWLAWSTAGLLSVFVMSGSIYYYFSTQL